LSVFAASLPGTHHVRPMAIGDMAQMLTQAAGGNDTPYLRLGLDQFGHPRHP
jgi:hypothetical protein